MDVTDNMTTMPLLTPDWDPDGENPDRTRADKPHGLLRTWFTSDDDIHSTVDTNNVQWGIDWGTPASVMLLFLLGIFAALGHHIYYSALHHTTVRNEVQQRWTLWIGSSLSFFTKVTLTAALGISRTQWVWLTLRNKLLTIRGIDVTTDPTYVTNTIMLKRAKAATIMAIAMWMIPIATILTPGTISVDRLSQTEILPCSVRSLRFPFDHNSTATILADSGLADDLGFVNVGVWYKHPTVAKPEPWIANLVMQTFKFSAYTGMISRATDLPPVGSRSATTVGEKCGANCSYTVEFLGPSVNCTKFTSWSTVGWYNEWMFMGGHHYFAAGMNNLNHPILVGVLSNEKPFHPIVFLCRSSTSRYTVKQVIRERSFLEPIILKVEPIILPSFQASAIYPDTTYLGQSSLINVFGRLLFGYHLQNRYLKNKAEITWTPIMQEIVKTPIHMGTLLEQMAHRMVVSLLASGVWLNGTAYALDVTATQQTNCTTTNYNVLYVYSARTLILVYSLTVACALIMTGAGFFALGQNGMASTQTPSLDESIVGHNNHGGVTMSVEMEKVELRFGELRTGDTGIVHFLG